MYFLVFGRIRFSNYIAIALVNLIALIFMTKIGFYTIIQQIVDDYVPKEYNYETLSQQRRLMIWILLYWSLTDTSL